VAQTGIKEHVSAFYPPRARWYRRLFFPVVRAVRSTFHLERMRLPGELSTFDLGLSLVVPGFSFFVLRQRILGWSFLAAYTVAALVFIVALGFPAASIAYGLAISIHATSIVYLEGLWLRESRFGLRLGLALCTLVGVWGLVYTPIVALAERHLLMPLRLGERVLVVQRHVAPRTIKRGDWLAYETGDERQFGRGEGQVYLRSGLGIDPVLALPGDHVRFTPQGAWVNDQLFPLAPHMPTGGELVVPEKVWFIWPSLAITGHGRATESDLSALMQRIAMVEQTQIIGRPFRNWFGRHQWP
jgi:hypothetical protein